MTTSSLLPFWLRRTTSSSDSGGGALAAAMAASVLRWFSSAAAPTRAPPMAPSAPPAPALPLVLPIRPPAAAPRPAPASAPLSVWLMLAHPVPSDASSEAAPSNSRRTALLAFFMSVPHRADEAGSGPARAVSYHPAGTRSTALARRSGVSQRREAAKQAQEPEASATDKKNRR